MGLVASSSSSSSSSVFSFSPGLYLKIRPAEVLRSYCLIMFKTRAGARVFVFILKKVIFAFGTSDREKISLRFFFVCVCVLYSSWVFFFHVLCRWLFHDRRWVMGRKLRARASVVNSASLPPSYNPTCDVCVFHYSIALFSFFFSSLS